MNEILQMVRDLIPPGRFLQKASSDAAAGGGSSSVHTDEGWWEEIDEVKAMAKISQALREGAPAFRAAHGSGRSKKAQSNVSKRRPSVTTSTESPKQGKRKSASTKQISLQQPKAKRRASKTTAAPTPTPTTEAAFVTSATPDNSYTAYEMDTKLPAATHLTANNNHGQPHPLDIGELSRLFSFNSHSNNSGSSNGNGLHIGAGKGNGNGKGKGRNNHTTPLSPHPLVPNSDFTASIADVAAAIPPTPPAFKKRKVTAFTARKASGNVITPHLLPSTTTPPPVSPYEGGESTDLMSAENNWDPLAFFSPTTPKAVTQINTNIRTTEQQGLIKTPNSFYLNRAHSLSLSDLNEMEDFTNPFENEEEVKNSNSVGGAPSGKTNQGKPNHLELQMRRHSLNFLPGYTQPSRPPYLHQSMSNTEPKHPYALQIMPPPPYNLPMTSFPPPTPMSSIPPPRGLSFGRIGSVPTGSYLGRKSSSSFSRDSANRGGNKKNQGTKRHDSNSSDKQDKSSNKGGSNNFCDYQRYLHHDESFRSVLH